DPALASALEHSAKHGLMEIAVSEPAGAGTLDLLVWALGANRVLEVGTLGGVVEVCTLGGYSTIWMARGLGEGGKLVTFELDEKTAGVAKENIAHAGLADRVGPAEKSLAAMTGTAEEGTYDFAFIDAFIVNNVTHIVNNVTHMKECKRLVKSGGVIV
ncbi:S-adenosyl-L-methionine-dependent methyltransferase, partial [Schizophyllum commune]